MAVINLYQPWRAILSMINQCLTGKTSGHDRPRYPEFVQDIQTFLTDKANLGSPTKKGKKDKPHVIMYYQFTKLIIYQLGGIHNIHQRSTSPFHLAEEDLRLCNLKFVPKGKVDEVFGMPIPNELISNNIRNAPYYNAYLEMVAKHDQKVAAEKEGKKKTTSAKTPKSKPAIEKSSKPAPTPKPKATKERPSKASTAKPPKPKPAKKNLLQRPPDHSQWLKAKRQTLVTEEASTRPSAQAQDDTSVNIVRNSPSPADAEIEIGAASEKTNSGKKMDELDQGHAGSDPGRTPESRPPSEQVVMDEDQAGSDPRKNHGDLAGLDPEPTYDEFMVDLYPKFINDKSTEDEPGKLNAELEVVSMVTVLTHQASSSIPPLSTPIIDLSPLKPASSTKAPIFTATTTTTTTNLPLPPPPPQQSSLDFELVLRVTALEQKLAAFEKKRKTLDNTTQNLGSRVFTLELRDLPHKIDEAVRESVKDTNGSYKSLPEHVALYEALEASIERAQRDEFLAEKDNHTYQAPAENSLLEKTRDLRTFMHCGPPGHVTIQTQFFFNHDLDYLRYGNKESGQALSNSKMKAACYLDFGFEYKHDYTIIDLPRAIVFPLGNNERKIIRFNKIYKFSDGTLTNIVEALDFRDKEYKVQVKMEMEIPCSSRVYFITACSYSTDTSKELMKVQVTRNNQAFTIKKSMSMSVQLSQAQDDETPQVDDQRLDLADDLKEAQVHISSSITSHETKITTSIHENFITRDIVHQLNLPTETHPLPYNLGKFKVTECCCISFFIGKYNDKMFDVIDTISCHVILGKPWVYDLNAIYNIEDNTYKFKHNGGRFILVLLMECNHVSEPNGKNSFIMRYQDFEEEREDKFLVNSTITTTMIQDETSNRIPKNLKSLEEVSQALIPDELQPILSPTQDIPLLNFLGHDIEKEHMVQNMEVIHGVKKHHVEFDSAEDDMFEFQQNVLLLLGGNSRTSFFKKGRMTQITIMF
nr:hypothetical protein [Tanacetum cinerariifolium]